MSDGEVGVKPIDVFIRKQQNDVRATLNKAFDLGWDAAETHVIGVLEELKAKCEHKLSISKSFTESSNEAYIALQAFQVAIALIKGEK